MSHKDEPSPLEMKMADYFFASRLGRSEASKNNLNWSSLVEQATAPAQAWRVPEAFLAVLFEAATCDGDLGRAEHEELLAIVHRSRALKSLSPEQLAAANVEIVRRLREDDGALAAACAALPEDMRLPAFAHALDLVLADGELSEAEADFLNTLILNLKLNGAEVEQVADVMVMKNRY